MWNLSKVAENELLLHFESIIDVVCARDSGGNASDAVFLGCRFHRAAQSDFAIGGYDFAVSGVNRHVWLIQQFLANVGRHFDVRLVFVLIDRRDGTRFGVSLVDACVVGIRTATTRRSGSGLSAPR